MLQFSSSSFSLDGERLLCFPALIRWRQALNDNLIFNLRYLLLLWLMAPGEAKDSVSTWNLPHSSTQAEDNLQRWDSGTTHPVFASLGMGKTAQLLWISTWAEPSVIFPKIILSNFLFAIEERNHLHINQLISSGGESSCWWQLQLSVAGCTDLWLMGHINSQMVSAWMAGSGRGGRFRVIAIPILGSSYLLLILHIREYFKKLKMYQSDFNLL